MIILSSTVYESNSSRASWHSVWYSLSLSKSSCVSHQGHNFNTVGPNQDQHKGEGIARYHLNICQNIRQNIQLHLHAQLMPENLANDWRQYVRSALRVSWCLMLICLHIRNSILQCSNTIFTVVCNLANIAKNTSTVHVSIRCILFNISSTDWADIIRRVN